MASARPHAYSIRLSKLFETQVEETFGTWERWDEVSETLTKDLPVRPGAFPSVPGTGYRAVTIETDPPRTVYFVINDEDECLDFEGLL